MLIICKWGSGASENMIFFSFGHQMGSCAKNYKNLPSSLLLGINDECHAKVDLFKVKKIGKFLVFKIVLILFYSKQSHILVFGIKLTRNSSIFHEITPLFAIPDSIPTVIGAQLAECSKDDYPQVWNEE